MSTQSQSRSRSWLIVIVAVLIAGLALFIGSLLARMNDSSDTTDVVESETDYQVVATIHPLAMIAREVSGDIVDVSSIIPTGATPHGFEPTVSNVATAQQADLVLAVGGDFDEWILSSANPNATLVEMLAIADHDHKEEEMHSDAMAEDDHAEEDGHDAHHHEDPHVWLDPHVAQDYALEVAGALSLALPEYAPQFRANAQAFIAEVEVVEGELLNRISDAPLAESGSLAVITMHDAYEPLAEAFGFTVAGSYEPDPGQSPSPSDIAELKELAESKNVQFFATESQLEGIDASVPRQIACDLGVYLITFNPLGTDGQTYAELLTSIIIGLTGQPFEGPEFDCIGR